MSNMNMGEDNKVVPIFKNFDELQQDQTRIADEFVADWNGAIAKYDSAHAEIEKREGTMLAKRASKPPATASKGPATPAVKKMSGPDQCIAALKSVRAELAAKIDTVREDQAIMKARITALAERNIEMMSAIKKHDDELYGVNKTARRSARFAQVHSRQYRGPAATVTTMVK